MANQIDIAIQPQQIQVGITRAPNISFEVNTKGAAGIGTPAGGTTDQVLTKNSNANYDFKWADQTGGGGGVSEELAIAYAIAL